MGTAPPDALMIRYVRDGVAAMCRVPEHRMAAFLEGGWILVMSESQLRAADLEETRQADQQRFGLSLRERMPPSR